MKTKILSQIVIEEFRGQDVNVKKMVTDTEPLLNYYASEIEYPNADTEYFTRQQEWAYQEILKKKEKGDYDK